MSEKEYKLKSKIALSLNHGSRIAHYKERKKKKRQTDPIGGKSGTIFADVCIQLGRSNLHAGASHGKHIRGDWSMVQTCKAC